MSDQLRVTFEPSGRAVTVLSGTKVLEAAAQAGLTVDTPCGGQAVCGKCMVRVVRGAGKPTTVEAKRFSAVELGQGWRLACQVQIDSAAVIHVPETSLMGAHHQILVERQKTAAAEVMPAVRKVYVELTAPTLHDNDPDVVRLERKLGKIKLGLDMLRLLSPRLRDANFAGTAVLTDHHLIDFERGDTTARCHGMAFDIGTTTIVGSLLDLRTGREVGVASGINPQVSFGDDVLSRIKHSGSCDDCLGELRKSVLVRWWN